MVNSGNQCKYGFVTKMWLNLNDCRVERCRGDKLMDSNLVECSEMPFKTLKISKDQCLWKSFTYPVK